MVRHAGENYGGLVFLGRLVVEDLVFWIEAGGLHAGEASGVGGNCCVFGLLGEGLNPDGVAVNAIHAHLVLVAAAEGLRKLSSLVRVQRVAHIVNLHDNILFLRIWFDKNAVVGGVRRVVC